MPRLAIALVVGTLAASPAWSQGYIGAAIGESKLDGPTDTAVKGFAGYEFKPGFAIEGAYQDLGAVSIAGRTGNISAFDVSFIGAWPLGNRFALLGRIGAYRAETSGAGTNLGPVFGLGASYELTPSAAFRLEWQRFDKLGPDTMPSLDIDVVSIGALYRF
jgi:OOP family OmpA-OmpF porin